jgi:hypothetical protein
LRLRDSARRATWPADADYNDSKLSRRVPEILAFTGSPKV